MVKITHIFFQGRGRPLNPTPCVPSDAVTAYGGGHANGMIKYDPLDR